MSRWVANDAAAPGDWLIENRESEVYDPLAVGYATALHRVDPEAATRWARSINDAALREQTLQRLEGVARGQ